MIGKRQRFSVPPIVRQWMSVRLREDRGGLECTKKRDHFQGRQSRGIRKDWKDYIKEHSSIGVSAFRRLRTLLHFGRANSTGSRKLRRAVGAVLSKPHSASCGDWCFRQLSTGPVHCQLDGGISLRPSKKESLFAGAEVASAAREMPQLFAVLRRQHRPSADGCPGAVRADQFDAERPLRRAFVEDDLRGVPREATP